MLQTPTTSYATMLNEAVTIQRNTGGSGGYGANAEDWDTVALNVPCRFSAQPSGGRSEMLDLATLARTRTVFFAEGAPVLAGDRIVRDSVNGEVWDVITAESVESATHHVEAIATRVEAA